MVELVLRHLGFLHRTIKSRIWAIRRPKPDTYPAVHEPLDPEYSILKQRLARRLRYEGADESAVQRMTLVDLTKARLP